MDSLNLNPFHLVEFITKGKKIARCVDCLTIKWIRFDIEKKKFMAKYIPPPYTEKTKAIVRMMVEGELDAPDHWPEYHIKLVGHASKLFIKKIFLYPILYMKICIQCC